MKTILYAICLTVMLGMVLSPAPSYAWYTFGGGEPPWDAPMMPGGKIVKTEGGVVIVEFDQPYEKVLAWYQEAMKAHRDKEYNIDFAKFRDWKDQMYIEDQGSAHWHSIGIAKGTGPTTTVKIVRDNFTWIFSTLLIRFAGVFFVLCLLWVLLNINSALMKKFFPQGGAKASAK